MANNSTEKNALLKMHISDMDNRQLERLRIHINNDDNFRKKWRNSKSELRVKKAENLDERYRKERGDVLAGKHDQKLLNSFEQSTPLEIEQLMYGQHPRQKEAEALGSWQRYRQILATTPTNELGETSRSAQLMLFNEDPQFRKAYQTGDVSLIQE